MISPSSPGDAIGHKPCLLCQGVLEPLRLKGEEREYGACPDCRWISLEERFHPSPEQQKERYLQHENSAENAGYVEGFERFIEACVEPFAPKGGRLLDFGCGPEPVLAGLLAKRGFVVDTVDLFFGPSPDPPGENYDLILLTEVLEHLPDPRKVLESLLPRLKRGGGFAVTTLFHPDDSEAFAKWWYRRDPTHVSFFTRKTLGRLAEALGLDLAFADSVRFAVLAGKAPR